MWYEKFLPGVEVMTIVEDDGVPGNTVGTIVDRWAEYFEVCIDGELHWFAGYQLSIYTPPAAPLI